MSNKAERIIEALEPVAAEHGLDLVTVEVAGTTKNPVLRIYLDTPEGGITLDQLAEAQRWVDAEVEALDPFQYSYVLEVSSPGIDRPLRKRGDYERFAGEEAVIYLKPGEARTKVTGVLAGVSDDAVALRTAGGEELVPLARIKKANIVGTVDFNARKFDALEKETGADEDGKE